MNVALEWRQYTWQPLNSVVQMLDHEKVRRLVQRVISMRIGQEEASNLYGQWIPKAALLATVACDCIDANTSATAKSGCFDLYNLTNVILTALTPQTAADATLLAGNALAIALQEYGSVSIPDGLLDAIVDSIEVLVKALSRT